MFFLNHPLVRGHFLAHGRVLSLRAKKREREGVQALVHGSRFKHRSLGRGEVRLLRGLSGLTPRLLAPYVRHSGFARAADWIEAYEGFNRGKRPEPAHLYEVQRVAEGASSGSVGKAGLRGSVRARMAPARTRSSVG